MVNRNDILAARDAALACLDSLLHVKTDLEQCWRWDRIGELCKSEHRLEPRDPDDIDRFTDERLQELTRQGHTDIHLHAEELDDHYMIEESYRRGPAPGTGELEAFLRKAKLLVETLRRSAVVANDEALTDGVCTALDLARARQVTLADRSYSNCHLAAVEYVAKFALCWPGNFPPPELSLCKAFVHELRAAVDDHADELHEIAVGIRTEAAEALQPSLSSNGGNEAGAQACGETY